MGSLEQNGFGDRRKRRVAEPACTRAGPDIFMRIFQNDFYPGPAQSGKRKS